VLWAIVGFIGYDIDTDSAYALGSSMARVMRYMDEAEVANEWIRL